MHLTKSLVLGAVAATALTASSAAYACSYWINQLAKGNELGAAGLSHLGVSLSDVVDVNVTEFRFFESISTPMCPLELTYTTTVDATWYDPTALVPTRCAARVSVKKVEPWGERRREHYDRFEVTELEAKVCVTESES